MFENINEKNHLLFAVKIYDNPSCLSEKEFFDDYRKIKSIEKHFRKYKRTGNIRDRLVLNHFITIFNIFGKDVIRILFLKIEKENWGCLKAFLQYLNYLPDYVFGINGININTHTISSDETLCKILKKYG